MSADIGRKIKQELEKQEITISHLVKKTKLSQSSVDNVIYGRSKKREIISKIARALAVPIDYLLEGQEINKFNASLYHIVFNIAYEQLKMHKVVLTKEIQDEYCYNTYLHAMQEKVTEPKILRSYLNGMISFGIRQGYLKLK